jgi:hypothetical protein
MEFASNNEEYVKIKEATEEKVKDVLTNSKVLLKFATAAVIESLRRNHELSNFVVNDISDNNDTDRSSYGSNYRLLMSQQQQSISDDIYSALILEEAEKLYNNLATKLVNEVMAAAAIKASSLPLSLPSNNSQKLNYENDA